MSEENPPAASTEGGEEQGNTEETPAEQTEAQQEETAEQETTDKPEDKPASPAAEQEAVADAEATQADEDGGKQQSENAVENQGEAQEDGKPPTPAAGSKPASPTGEAAEAKPATPQPGSKPGSPTQAAEPAGSKPGTPTEQAPAGSKPGTPTEQAPAGSKPGTPTEQAPAGSKPGTPAEQTPTGSKPGTPAEQTPTGSKPGTPAEQAPAGSKPGTPAEQAPAGSKPGTPAEQAPAGSKPGTPAEQAPAGSKPGTPAEQAPAGSKPGTPAEQVPAETSQQPAAGSKPGTPQAAGSKPATPAAGSRPSTQTQKAPPSVPPPPPIGPEAAASKVAQKEEKASSSALNMSWSFGVSRNVPVLNLTDDLRRSIMYPCANAGIVYEFESNTQIILQGHSNDIKCTCTSSDKRWVATADVGPDNMIIVWDSYTGVPVRTIFEPYPDSGVIAIAMTPDAKYIATLSASEKQVLAIWDWTVEGEVPVCSVMLDPKFGVQNYVLFNPEDPYQLVTNSETQVIFCSWNETGKLEIQPPPLSDEDFNKPVGRFSQSIFQAGSTRALTATSIGNLVVWDTVRPTYTKDTKKMPEKKALKLVRLQDRGINVLTTTDEFIVAGDVLGHVKFFDQTLKLMNWYQDLHLGPINSLSFAHWPEFSPEMQAADYPKDATIKARQFVIRDFVIGTYPAVYAHVTTDGTNIDIIHRDHDAAVYGLSAHPSRHHIAVGSYSGLLKIWDYERKEALVSRWFDKGLMIRCCTFDDTGDHIAVGFTNGSLRVVDALTLNDILSEPFRYARDAITHVAFSHDGRYLATADAEYTVSLFKAQRTGEPWIYLGRNRAHYKLIQDLCFGIQLDSDAPRLLSLGEDRVLVEYDLENSGPDDLRIASTDRIEQSAVPQCMAWYPAVTAEFFIVTANDQFKFKLYNATTKMCRKTLLGPTYGSPVQKLVIIPRDATLSDPSSPTSSLSPIVILPTDDAAHSTRYLAYVTADKIGIHKLPLDGNPHNAMALIAHPQGVANLVSSFDGKHMFTAGGSDCTVHMWDINIPALEAQSKLGGENLVPFYGLLEGGRDGDLYKELEDYFYYAQIRSQGVDTMDSRRVSTHIPLSEIPFVMRAMGFYPSEQEIEDMLNEVRYSRYVETGQYMTEIELGDFIKLYINHRPAFGLQPEKIEWAFRVLGMDTAEGPTVDRGDLLDKLQSKGEHLTEEELAEYLTTLLGYGEEGGALSKYDPSYAGDIIEENLPIDVTAEMFANELLGFSMYSDVLQTEQSIMGQQAA